MSNELIQVKAPPMKALVFLFMVMLSLGTVAQKFSDEYKVGDKLYVCSKEGISLRPAPDAKAAKIIVVSYATAVIVQADPNPRVPFVSTGVPGAWVKVTAGGKLGYVFDGFISRFKPMDLATDPRGRDLEEITQYLTTLSKVETKKTWSAEAGTSPPEECDFCFGYEKIVLASGAEYEQRAYEGGSVVSISFPSSIITFQETYLMARMMYNEFFTTPCPYNEGDMTCLFENDENITLKISKDGGRNTIQWGHAD